MYIYVFFLIKKGTQYWPKIKNKKIRQSKYKKI